MNYGINPRSDAAIIAAECIRAGSSSGWSGSIKHRDAIASILAPFGIVYTDDLSGTWTAAGIARALVACAMVHTVPSRSPGFDMVAHVPKAERERLHGYALIVTETEDGSLHLSARGPRPT